MNISIEFLLNKIKSNALARFLIKNKTIVSFIFLILIPTFYVYYDHFIEPSATKEDIDKIRIDLEKRYPDYNIKITCDNLKSPTSSERGAFIDECVLMSKPLKIEGGSGTLALSLRSDWHKSKNQVHYIMDLSSDSAEISVFEENNVIIMNILSNGVEHSIKLPIKELNWKDEWYSNDWNYLYIKWDAKNKNILLDVNGVKKSTFGDFTIDFSNATLFIGSSNDNKYFAESWVLDILAYEVTSFDITIPSDIFDAESMDKSMDRWNRIQFYGSSNVGDVWKQIQFSGQIPKNTNISMYVNTSSDNTIWFNWIVQTNVSAGVRYDLPSDYQNRYGRWGLIIHSDDNPFLLTELKRTIHYQDIIFFSGNKHSENSENFSRSIFNVSYDIKSDQW